MKINYPKQRKLKGLLSLEHRKNISKAVPKGINHSSWKGDDVGYAALHEWVYKKLGNPKVCSNCGTVTAKRFEWANKSGKYKRIESDWIRLCTRCHRQFDTDSLKGAEVEVKVNGKSYKAIIK